jgi:hypothetical protein
MLHWLFFSAATLAAAQISRVSPAYGHDFEFPLPIMPVKTPLMSYTNTTTETTIDFYQVRMQAFKKRLFPDVQDAELIGYDGIEPGPTFRVKKGQETVVRVVNEMFRPAAVHLHGSYSELLSYPSDAWRDCNLCLGRAREFWHVLEGG